MHTRKARMIMANANDVVNQTIETQAKLIKAALIKLRPHFDAGTPDLEILSQVLRNGHGECCPETVEAFAVKMRDKKFSTADVMQFFQVSKYKVAGSLAALSGAGKIRKTGELDDNGYSVYEWVGRKTGR
jgi:hypothetical protein